MKTLIVKYLPSADESNTKKLLDFFKSNINSNIEELDLLQTDLEFFTEESLQAYKKRNYMGQKLDENESKLLQKHDQLAKQLKSCDILVLAYPMHNFGMPAKIKAWLDLVVLKGETFDNDKKMMSGKKALTLYTSGGFYSNTTFNFDYPNWNSIALISAANFQFMGFDEYKTIGTSLRNEADNNLEKTKEEISEVIASWY